MVGISRNLASGTIVTNTLKRCIVNHKQLLFHKLTAIWYLAFHLKCASKEYKATARGKLERQSPTLDNSKGWKHLGLRFGGI